MSALYSSISARQQLWVWRDFVEFERETGLEQVETKGLFNIACTVSQGSKWTCMTCMTSNRLAMAQNPRQHKKKAIAVGTQRHGLKRGRSDGAEPQL